METPNLRTALSLALSVSLSVALLVGCGGGPDLSPPTEPADPREPTETTETTETIEPSRTPQSLSQAIVDVDQTAVKRQSIGNCWIYATASWAESLTLTGSTKAENFSESYWTYWSWFDQIVGRRPASISTGGSFSTMTRLIASYGVISEGDFIAEEATAEMSLRQKRALDAMNDSLASGALAEAGARADRALVRRELDRAFGLSAAVSAELDRVFGPDVSRSFRRGTPPPPSAKVRSPDAIAVAYAAAKGDLGVTRTTLRAALSDWRESWYPPSASGRRALLQRFQRAMHARVPVLLTWFVDFNALDNASGAFLAPPTRPGNQGHHMTVAEDYEVRDVPGFGTLRAGQEENRPEALAAALDPSAQIVLIRTKNSWGQRRPDRGFLAGLPGYHDLHLKYLDGPVKECDEVPDGQTERNCERDVTPLSAVIMPSGF